MVDKEKIRPANMVKFRNRAVHLYDEVDDGEVYIILQSNLDDFERFIGIIVQKFM